MKKNLSVFIFILFLNNCAGFEFAYNTNNNIFLLKDNTKLNVDGDDAYQVYASLITLIGDKKDNYKYRLLINSTKTETARAIDKDATASKFDVEYIISYDLYNTYKNCKILNKEIATLSSYNSKAAGYSFGTNLSKKESSNLNINKNINQFAAFANAYLETNSCIQ